jgi:exodeoxyribonuclease V beta subunit
MGLSRTQLDRAVSREVGGDAEKGIFPDSRVVSPARGYMRGFVDMVFRHDGWYYIVDWKSNYLGPQVGDYHPDALHQVMVAERYTLQYLIYTLALDQYLAMRVPKYDYDRHFGGVFYLFVRGMDPARGGQLGVYSARPDDRAVRRLAQEIIGQAEYRVRRKPGAQIGDADGGSHE